MENLEKYASPHACGWRTKNLGTRTIVEGWLIEYPGWSPAWWHFLVVVNHLRDVPDVKRATKRFQQATHELVVMGLDPTACPIATDPATWRHLEPVNAVWQFVATDEQAAAACAQLAREAIDGKLCLETQGISVKDVGTASDQWAKRLSELLPKGARIE